MVVQWVKSPIQSANTLYMSVLQVALYLDLKVCASKTEHIQPYVIGQAKKADAEQHSFREQYSYLRLYRFVKRLKIADNK